MGAQAQGWRAMLADPAPRLVAFGGVKAYPSIDTRIAAGEPLIVFDKLDGSNIRAAWEPKKGFHQFGTRHRVIDASAPVFGEAVGLILEGPAAALEAVFRARKWKHAIAYFEFHGPGSFAGEHAAEPHSVTLFDVSADKRGLLEPAVFRGLFEGVVAVPRVLHAGPVDDAFVARVRASELPGLTFEGVVAKGAYASPGLPRMFKIKTQRWLERLRVKCGDDEALFERLR